MNDKKNFCQLLDQAVQIHSSASFKDALYFYQKAIELLPEPYKTMAYDVITIKLIRDENANFKNTNCT